LIKNSNQNAAVKLQTGYHIICLKDIINLFSIIVNINNPSGQRAAPRDSKKKREFTVLRRLNRIFSSFMVKS